MASLKPRHHTWVAILAVLILVLFMAAPAFADHSQDSDRGRGHDEHKCDRDKDDHDGRDYDDYGDDGDEEEHGSDDDPDAGGDESADGEEEGGDGRRHCEGDDADDDEDVADEEAEPSPSPSPTPSDDDDTKDSDTGSEDDNDIADGTDSARGAGDSTSHGDSSGDTGERSGAGTTASTRTTAATVDDDAARATTRATATASTMSVNDLDAGRPSGPLTCPDGTDFAGFLTPALAACDLPGVGGGWSGTFLAAQGTKICTSGPFKGMPTLDESECDVVLGKRVLPLTGAGGVLPMLMLAGMLLMTGSAALKVGTRT